MNCSFSLTFNLTPVAEEVSTHIQDIYNRMQQGLVQLADSKDFANAILPNLARKEELAEEIVANITRIAAKHRTNFSSEVEVAETAAERANTIATNVSEIHDRFRDLYQKARDQYIDPASYVDHFSSVEEVNITLEEVQSSLDNAAVIVSDLRADVDIVNDVIDESEIEIKSSRQIIVRVGATVAEVGSGVDNLTLGIGSQTFTASGSGLEPEPEDSMECGLGIEPVGTLTDQIGSLQRGVECVEVMMGRCDGEVQRASQSATSLRQAAEELERYCT